MTALVSRAHGTFINARSFHSTAFHRYSIADKVKNAIYALAPKEIFADQLGEEENDEDTKKLSHQYVADLEIPYSNLNIPNQNTNTTKLHSSHPSLTLRSTNLKPPYITQGVMGSHVHLPSFMLESIKPLGSPGDKIIHIIKTYPTVSPRAILILIKPILSSLSDSHLIQISIYLYSHFYPREACNLLSTAQSLAPAIASFSDLIPALTQSQIDRTDFILLNITSTLLATNKHSLVLQLLQEIQNTTNLGIIPPHELFEQAKLANRIFTASSTADLDIVLDNTPTRIFYKTAPPPIKLAILKAVAIFKDPDLLSSLIKQDFPFFTSPYVLHNIISEVHHQYQLTDDPSAIETLIPVLFEVTNPYHTPSISFHPVDLALLPFLALTRPFFDKLWRRAQILLKKSPSPEAYKLFLEKAITLKLTHSATDILKDSQKSITSPALIASAINLVIWGRHKIKHKRPEKTVETQDKILSYQFLDVSLVKRIFKYTPIDILIPAITIFLKRLNAQYKTSAPINLPASQQEHPIPRSILWSLIKAIDTTPKTNTTLTPEIEQQLALLIATRPLTEQFEYYTLKAISVDGVLQAILAHIARLKQIPDTPQEANIQLILSALVMMKSKISHDLNPHLLSQIILSLFQLAPALNDPLPEIMAYIAPSEKASLDIVQSLLRKSNYTAALKYIDILGNNLPIEVLYAAMTYTSYARPALSMHFLRWLRVHRGIVPPPRVLRRMAIGFAKSPALSDSQSRVRIEKVARVLSRHHKASLGPHAARVFVDSLLARALARGQGSRQRLRWAIGLARHQNVPPEQIQQWMRQIDYMRMKRVGYWAPGSSVSAKPGHTGVRPTLSHILAFFSRPRPNKTR
ncbi:uncharacterized protein SAPINGB_P002932 [Magnusiomyces paraingens]|uniref:Uncharacterized protein n=1 Tax=Magnusiomyces paraingens TaxID=2606893 RepID=A0A5E8BH20_9ASCO|nr:uncharacterized protein SAPINGB_P002932 [Saprochaete ingens]VVT50944.1 unnamed protein product [Saprochaete ingens]